MNDKNQNWNVLVDCLWSTTSATKNSWPYSIASVIPELKITSITVVESLENLSTLSQATEVILLALKRFHFEPKNKTSDPNNDQVFSLSMLYCSSDNGSFIYFDWSSQTSWKVDLRKKTISKHQNLLPSKVSLAIYCQTPVETTPFKLNEDQASIKCPQHMLPFCQEFKNSSYMCSFDQKCNNKVNWRCPIEDCSLGLCKKRHFQYSEQNSVSLFSREAPTLDLLAPSASTSSALHFDTDAGSSYVPLEENEFLGNDVASMHALLNNISSVLERCHPFKPSARLKRFFQRFLCLLLVSCPIRSVVASVHFLSSTS